MALLLGCSSDNGTVLGYDKCLNDGGEIVTEEYPDGTSSQLCSITSSYVFDDGEQTFTDKCPLADYYYDTFDLDAFEDKAVILATTETGTVYGDGFLCENLGINEATFDDVLAVDVLGKNAFDGDMPDNFFKTMNVLEMFEKSIRLLIYNQTRSHIRHSAKKITLLEPDTKEYKTFYFHKTEEIRALGLGLLSGVEQ